MGHSLPIKKGREGRTFGSNSGGIPRRAAALMQLTVSPEPIDLSTEAVGKAVERVRNESRAQE